MPGTLFTHTLLKITSADSVSTIANDTAFDAVEPAGNNNRNIARAFAVDSTNSLIYGYVESDESIDDGNYKNWIFKSTATGTLTSFSTSDIINHTYTSGATQYKFYDSECSMIVDSTGNIYLTIMQTNYVDGVWLHHPTCKLVKITSAGVVSEPITTTDYIYLAKLGIDSSDNLYFFYAKDADATSVSNYSVATMHFGKLTGTTLTSLETITDYQSFVYGTPKKVIARSATNLFFIFSGCVYNVPYISSAWSKRLIYDATNDTYNYVIESALLNGENDLVLLLYYISGTTNQLLMKTIDSDNVDNLENTQSIVSFTASSGIVFADFCKTPANDYKYYFTTHQLIGSDFHASSTCSLYSIDYWRHKCKEFEDAYLNGTLTLTGVIGHIVSNYIDFGTDHYKRIRRAHLLNESNYATGGVFYIEPDRTYQDTIHYDNEPSKPDNSYWGSVFSNRGKTNYDTDSYFDSTKQTENMSRINLGGVARSFRFSIYCGDVASSNPNRYIIKPPILFYRVKGIR